MGLVAYPPPFCFLSGLFFGFVLGLCGVCAHCIFHVLFMVCVFFVFLVLLGGGCTQGVYLYSFMFCLFVGFVPFFISSTGLCSSVFLFFFVICFLFPFSLFASFVFV
jgi:hypothetical protein